MMTRRLLLFLALLPWDPSRAVANSPIAEVLCDPTPRLEARLTQRMGQLRQGLGLRDPEQRLEIWVAPSGDWTLVAAYADGLSCVLAMGEAWQQNPAFPVPSADGTTEQSPPGATPAPGDEVARDPM